jgi:hypothetical protein
MMQACGAITAQIQDIVKKQFAQSVRKYQMLENGKSWTVLHVVIQNHERIENDT